MMAKPSLSAKRAAELERQQHSAAITIALQRSKKVIEAKIRARGHKVSAFSARDLRVLAEQYFEEHRAALLADATTTVERWTLEGVFGKRAQRAFGANLTTGAQQVGHCSDKTISVQNSSAERRAEQ